jgi:chemotaxis protein CheX
VQYLEEEISQLAAMIWDSVLGMTLVRRSRPGPDGRHITGCVRMTGAWEGAVSIECGAEFARTAAAVMFGMDAAAASPADTRDAIGELANMAGGNVKALLPEPCRLSLPAVAEDGTGLGLPTGELVTAVAFDCQGAPVVVRLYGHRSGGGVS